MFIDNGLTQAQIKAAYSVHRLGIEGNGKAVDVRFIAQTDNQWLRIKAKAATGHTGVRVICNRDGDIVAIMRRDRNTYNRIEKLWREAVA